jgi:hypothetical protein
LPSIIIIGLCLWVFPDFIYPHNLVVRWICFSHFLYLYSLFGLLFSTECIYFFPFLAIRSMLTFPLSVCHHFKYFLITVNMFCIRQGCHWPLYIVSLFDIHCCFHIPLSRFPPIAAKKEHKITLSARELASCTLAKLYASALWPFFLTNARGTFY